MRLQQIRLSGFKSFVEPISLILQHNISSVVGPNGCGKSNIVDAIIWVMGESSARHLRGESLSDVIFNGSRHRAAAQRASVELIFDNHSGRIRGRHASCQEIAIRRELDRETLVSGYFLNGTRCRRKDIQALFHGTGFGPRSYAVIEQGMISRLVEAKPEDLRVHLEEAADISGYRQARRETENRIRNTKENILRLNDIRDEVNKQLNVLQRQSKVAARYRALCAEEQDLQWQLWSLSWRELDASYQKQQSICRQQERSLEQERVRLREQEQALAQQRGQIDQQARECEHAQDEFYQFNAAIVRLEQDIQHAQARREELSRTQERLLQDCTQARQHYQEDQSASKSLTQEREALQPRLRELDEECSRQEQALRDAEQAWRDWQEHWDSCSDRTAEITRQEAEYQVRQGHLQEHQQRLDEQRRELQAELQGLDPAAAERSVSLQGGDLKAQEQSCRKLEQQERAARRKLEQLRTHCLQLEREWESQAASSQELHRHISSLDALQKAALKADQEAVHGWLQGTGLSVQDHLAQRLRVEPRWRRAVELALGFHLQSVAVADLDPVLSVLPTLEVGEFGACVENPAASVAAEAGELSPLGDYVYSPNLPADLLQGFYAAADLSAALRQRKHLPPGAVLVTPDGTLLGREWVRVVRVAAGQGILDREAELEQGRTRYEQAQARYRELEADLKQSRADAGQQEKVCRQMHQQLQQQREQLIEHRSALAASQVRAEQRRGQAQKLEREITGLQALQQDRCAEMERHERLLEELRARHLRLQERRSELLAQRERHEQEREELRLRQAAAREARHQCALQLEGLRSRRESLARSMDQHRELLSRLEQQDGALQAEKSSIEDALPPQQQELETAVHKQKHLEQQLRRKREQQEQLQEQWRRSDQERSEQYRKLRQREPVLQQELMKSQELRVRRDGFAGQLQEAGGVLEEVLQVLQENARESAWKERLEQCRRRMQQLGQVNLAAIGEHAQQVERKEYLDRQYQDLETALQTLEQGMRRMDKETRTRFKLVFDQINQNLKEFFPRLFGGGHAALVLSGEHLLESGISFMAQPPGKRNSSIHLLSGGEKALAALALVFSIFQLNPAPLCLLDEVDAPLDDPNVLRFGELMCSMSEQVQFVMITHNKISMERSEALFGVTMQESGVSRIVTVDMDRAVRMAAVG